MRDSMRRIWTLTKRNVKEIVRDPISLIFMMAMPLLMEVLFYFLFHNMTAQFEMRYLTPGIVVFAQAFLSLFIGLLIATDRGTSFLTRLYVSKTKPYEFIFSYALAVLPITLAQSVLFFVVGGIFDPALFGWGMVGGVAMSLFTSLLFIALGILFGSVCNEKSVGGIASIVISGQSVLSGMWFPVDGLGGAMMTLMEILPFRNAALAVQNVLNGVGGFDALGLPVLVVIAYMVATFWVSVLVFKAKMQEK